MLRYSETSSFPDHTYFAGPVIFENWEAFGKQEIFTFEGHEAETAQSMRKLLSQLYTAFVNVVVALSQAACCSASGRIRSGFNQTWLSSSQFLVPCVQRRGLRFLAA